MNQITRAEILDQAKAAVLDRGDAYGPPAEVLNQIAQVLNILLAPKLQDLLTADDVGLMMIALKTVRLARVPGHLDSITDLIGYASCLVETRDKADDMLEDLEQLYPESILEEAARTAQEDEILAFEREVATDDARKTGEQILEQDGWITQHPSIKKGGTIEK